MRSKKLPDLWLTLINGNIVKTMSNESIKWIRVSMISVKTELPNLDVNEYFVGLVEISSLNSNFWLLWNQQTFKRFDCRGTPQG